MYCNPQEQQLIRILKGRKTALSGPELAARLGMSDRNVRALVASLQSRINEIQAVKDGIEIGMGHMFEQQSLFEEAV